ncbi:hypothetical protein B5F53_11500 [Blautia sp. An249]|uniref:hypothetical protein n=1 Tax=Blautia sp. An249 TaxID=1965603 RepID=UPI000B3AC1ED|nr:hypothetical protein [Blautia sp. An249]OUO78166.1 hypothetical protein B5F53_11500 [Blautia sp. An249]
MALYRSIYLSFWKDTKVMDEFTAEDKYFFLYILTNIHTNLCGCYEISIKQMSIEMGYSIEQIKNILDKFISTYKMVDYDFDRKEILVINWHKYNWTSSPKIRPALQKEISEVKNDRFRNYLKELLGEDSDPSKKKI